MFEVEVEVHRHVSYDQALSWQRAAVDLLRADHDRPGKLLLVEHTPVLTMGRAARGDNLLVGRDELRRRGIDLRETRRGGDVTYHGPGQWTLYPVLALAALGKDLGRYLRLLEEVAITFLGRYGLRGERVRGRTGVWVRRDGRRDKVAAIGIAVTRWISYHGMAVNIHPDLAVFRRLIIPCGISPAEGGVASLDSLTGREHDMAEAGRVLLDAFFAVFPVRRVSSERPAHA